jgi:endonuclease/exonuclease/phosphatase family metal-dependent hydrolase
MASKTNFCLPDYHCSESYFSNKRDIKIVMGDLNAKVKTKNERLEDVMGRHGTNGINENGEIFIDFCSSQELTIGEILFIHTWVSPDLRTENQTDHIAISQSFKRSLIDVRTKRGPDIGSDHHLVVASFRFKITANKKKHDVMRKRLDVKTSVNAHLKH